MICLIKQVVFFLNFCDQLLHMGIIGGFYGKDIESLLGYLGHIKHRSSILQGKYHPLDIGKSLLVGNHIAVISFKVIGIQDMEEGNFKTIDTAKDILTYLVFGNRNFFNNIVATVNLLQS